METVSRTVRFKKDEADLIDRFLQENSFFDFSSLSRVAMLQFIQNPNLPLKPVAFSEYKLSSIQSTEERV